jgi:tetratricopeptide (TPR) repeat protein
MEWAVGTVVEDRWEVHRVLKGGMGVVYIVFDRHPDFRAAYAAKTFRDEIFERTPNSRDGFIQEASAWIELDVHPHVVRAQYYYEIGGGPFVFLEYVDGGDLGARIGTQWLTQDLERVLRLGMQFCSGMLHASKRGMAVHRDVKPANCLLTSSGDLKISDFGLVKLFDHEVMSTGSTQTQTGAAMGTPPYMAPEQFVDYKNVTTAADVYSFGVMLYQMVKGRVPFDGDTWDAQMNQHLRQRPPSLQSGISELDAIVTSCLAKDPNDRPADFGVVLDQLSHVFQRQTGKPPPSPPAGPTLTAFELCNKGASLTGLGKTEAAVGYLERAVKLCPLDELSWVNLGGAYHASGKYEAAEKCYARALRIQPKYPAALHNLGLTRLSQRRQEEAIELFEAALRRDPFSLETIVELGRAMNASGDREKAVFWFAHALEVAPTSTRAINAYAAFLTDCGDHQGAFRLYERSLAINDRQENVWYNQGVSLEDLGDFGKALECYSAAVQLNPKFATAWSGMGNALHREGRFSDATVAYERALELDGSLSQVWVNRGIAHTELVQFGEALSCFKMARDLGHPGGQELVDQCERVLRGKG